MKLLLLLIWIFVGILNSSTETLSKIAHLTILLSEINSQCCMSINYILCILSIFKNINLIIVSFIMKMV